MTNCSHTPTCPSKRRASTFGCAITAILLGVTSRASAQFIYNSTEDPRHAAGLRAVDQGVADQNVLSASARSMPIDLRQPTGFDQLFHLTGPGGRLEARDSAPSNGLFFRFSGGLTASFPRSIYADAPGGLRPLIPPGTVFSIGQRPAWGPGFNPLAPRAQATPNDAKIKAPVAVAHDVPRSARVASDSAALHTTSTRPRTPSQRRAVDKSVTEVESLWTSESSRRRLIERLLSIRSRP